MRTLIIAALVAAAAGVARADAAAVYVQGHGGYAGTSVKDVTAGSDSSLGPTLGGEVGAKFMAFNGYLNLDDYLSRGTVTRAVLGLGTDLSALGWRLGARIGAGYMLEKNNVFGDMAVPVDRSGVVGRAGLYFDRPIASGLYLGVGIDGEYFALKADSGVDTGVHTGVDILGSLHVGFELGI
jgi:hypothetical protein